MGSAILDIDQMHIVRKKSDSGHSDNDWLIVSWFVGGTPVRTDTQALFNDTAAPSVILETGEGIRPVSSQISCADADLVTASILVVNLGSTDYSQQANAAGQIAKSVSQELTKVYLRVAEEYVRANPEIPLREVWAQAIHEISPIIIASVGAAWDEVILPAVDAIVEELQILFGDPNCNGEVFHDLAVFQPNEPGAPQTWAQTYEASSVTGCDSAAQTVVVYTATRVFDPMTLPHTPPPMTGLLPLKGGTPEMWSGTWAEDPHTPTPIVAVTISEARPPRPADHTRVGPLVAYSVNIKERIDPRFHAEFDGGGQALVPVVQRVGPFTGDVFGSIKPWGHLPASPGELTLYPPRPPVSGSPSGTRRKNAPGDVGLPLIRLTWDRPHSLGTGVGLLSDPHFSLAGSGLTAESGALGWPSEVTVEGDVIEIPAQAIRLSLYVIKQNGRPIGNAVRYLRSENDLYTHADVMLFRWSAVD